MNWTIIGVVGALLCFKFGCYLIEHAILNRTSGQRKRERQNGIEWAQSQGKSARFLVYSDKLETWAEVHPYRFFAILAAGTALSAVAASPALLAYGRSLADWLRIAVDHFQAIQLPPALFVGALVIVAVALGIWEHRKSRASDARILALRRDRQPQIEANE